MMITVQRDLLSLNTKPNIIPNTIWNLEYKGIQTGLYNTIIFIKANPFLAYISLPG